MKSNQRRANIIAKVLVKCHFEKTEEQGILMCRNDFDRHFPEINFDDWNIHVTESFLKQEVDMIPENSNLNIKLFIERLSRP